MRLLWVEDDADVIFPVMKPIMDAGIVVDIAESYKEARIALEGPHVYDLFVVDLILPPGRNVETDNQSLSETEEYHGAAVVKAIRNKYTSAPIYILSVAGGEEVEHQLRAYGVTKILKKPIRPSELRDEVLKNQKAG